MRSELRAGGHAATRMFCVGRPTAGPGVELWI